MSKIWVKFYTWVEGQEGRWNEGKQFFTRRNGRDKDCCLMGAGRSRGIGRCHGDPYEIGKKLNVCTLVKHEKSWKSLA